MAEPINYIEAIEKSISIPVCYEEEFSPDIKFIAAANTISVEEIIQIHTSKLYKVYMLGFLPGFPYLGEVDDRIAVPRKAQPQAVAAGSVGIAGKQTGIYPLASPGGWQIIGRTPMELFNAANENPVLLKAGVLDTVQDFGRYGYQQLGINPGGVMDRWAAQTANILVGNKKDDAVIEVHFPAAELFFEKPVLISICGADFSPHVNAEEVPCWQPILVNRFSILQFYGMKDGARAYLAIHGGIDVEKWLGSYSTNIKAAAGGYKGRCFQKEDEIPVYDLSAEIIAVLNKTEFIILPWKAGKIPAEEFGNDILLLEGNEWNRLDTHSKEIFLNQPFTIKSNSDRMGYRLQGKILSATISEEIISSAVSFGTVQLLPDGQLIVLMADHQTTGGYPRVAHVITAHHSKLAQLKAGDKFIFRMTDQQTAENLLIKQQQHLLQLQNACTFRLQEYIHANRH